MHSKCSDWSLSTVPQKQQQKILTNFPQFARRSDTIPIEHTGSARSELSICFTWSGTKHLLVGGSIGYLHCIAISGFSIGQIINQFQYYYLFAILEFRQWQMVTVCVITFRCDATSMCVCVRVCACVTSLIPLDAEQIPNFWGSHAINQDPIIFTIDFRLNCNQQLHSKHEVMTYELMKLMLSQHDSTIFHSKFSIRCVYTPQTAQLHTHSHSAAAWRTF